MRSSLRRHFRPTLSAMVNSLTFIYVGDNQLQIVGKIVNKHSKLYGVPIENFYYISVCMRLGACFVDTRGERCLDPFWTITDVNDKNKQGTSSGKSKFRIFKNGIHFNFLKGQAGEASSSFVGTITQSSAASTP